MADEQTQIPATASTQGGNDLAPGEQQAVPTSNTPSPQADQNNPQSTDGDGTDQGNSSQQAQAPQGGQQPQDGTQGRQNGPDAAKGPSSPGNQPPNPNTPPPSAVHPAVQKASIIRDIAQTLGGGPRTSYSIDANTGKMTRTEEPLSTGQIGMAIALAALTGGINGLAQRGPGAEGRAAAAGFNATSQIKQEQDAQARQEASQNYARQAAVAQTNFQTHQNALRLSQMELDYHKQFVSTAAPILKNITDVGAAQATGVRESDLTNKYHVTKDMAIPDGTVENGKNPDGSTHFENTYTVVDPNKKIALPDETAKLLADLRVPGYFTMKDGKAVPTDFAGASGIKAGLVVNGLALAQSFQITEGQMNRQLAKLGDPEAAAQFDVNLKKSIADGTVSQKGLQTLAGYANLAPDLAVAAMEKDKVDPGVIQAYRKLVPQEALDASKMKRETAEADRKAADARHNLTPDKNNYDSVLANPKNFTPDQIEAAHQVKALKDQEDAQRDRRDINKAGAEAAARTTAEIKAKQAAGIGTGKLNEDDAPLINPKLAPLVQDPANYNTPTGTNEKFLEALTSTDPGRAAIVKAYANGMDLQSYYAAAKRFGGTINAYIHAYDPTFNANEMQAYNKTLLDARPSGPIGKANRSASTTFVHLNNLIKTIGVGSVTGQSGDYKATLGQATSEMSNAYANGNKPGEKEIEENREGLGAKTPWVAKGAIKASARNLIEKVAADYHAIDQQLPRGVQRPGFIDDDGANAYHTITGNKVDTRLIIKPRGTTGSAPDPKTGTLYWHDATGKPLAKVPGQ